MQSTAELPQLSWTPPTDTTPMTIIGNDPNKVLQPEGRTLVKTGISHHGAVLLRGFGASQDDFTMVIEAFSRGSVVFQSSNRRSLSTDVQTVYQVPSGLPLHSEFAGFPTPLWPEAGFLHANAFDCEGGQTLLCDSVELAKAIPAELRALFDDRGFQYRRTMTASNLADLLGVTVPELEDEMRSLGIPVSPKGQSYRLDHSAPGFERSANGGEQAFTAPILLNSSVNPYQHVLHKLGLRKAAPERIPGSTPCRKPSWGDGRLISRKVCRQLAATAASLTWGVPWQTGDILIWDNRRILHGREGYHGVRDLSVSFRRQLTL